MKEYAATALIKAMPEAVWRILTEASGYERWNPEIVGVEGRFAPGERIRARVKVRAGGGKMAVRAVPLRITAFEPGTRMEWTGGLPLGLFMGRRKFTVRPRGGGTQFRMVLRMNGLLCGMILKSVGDRQPEIDTFSSGQMTHAERA